MTDNVPASPGAAKSLELGPSLIFLSVMLLVLVLGNSIFSGFDERFRDFWFQMRLRSADTARNPWISKTAGLFPQLAPVKDIVLIIIDDRSILGIPGLYQGNR